ncbi:MAG: acyl-ACP--UDP-N-acetylglucosamine O-acyltransferase [Candidatus Omnitrophota bacterium]
MSTLETKIHPTAVIDPQAQIADGVEIGPFCVVGPRVVLGSGVSLASHCHVAGKTTIGERTRLFPGAVVGTDPQDKKFRSGENVSLDIGKNNIIREYVMINPGTEKGGGRTVIGDGNLFMAYSHVAHDCRIGSKCVFANVATIAGHVTVEDSAIVGGLTGVHQFVRIGRMAMVGGCSRVSQDVVPFAMCSGAETAVRSVNVVGLRRKGYSSDQARLLKRAFKILFFSGLNRASALEQIEKEIESDETITALVDFVRTSQRGIMGAVTPQYE